MLVIAVIAVAVLFDVYHQDVQEEKDIAETQSKRQSHELSDLCFFSAVNSFKLKSSVGKDKVRKLFLCTQSKFLQKYHNLKVTLLARMEAEKTYQPSEIVVHLINLHKCQYRNPDDTPFPLA